MTFSTVLGSALLVSAVCCLLFLINVCMLSLLLYWLPFMGFEGVDDF